MSAAIRVEGLGKRYQLGARKDSGRYRTLRDTVVDSASDALRRLRRSAREASADPTEFWALRDISFEVRRGEVLGVIGRNGAGKSTLLKVLSRITEPTEGRISVEGRVASLLEVGTGFHPELTGRENVFLNGAILGMQRSEIRAKFDEIVAFAEVERFLDTPVKRYSSGMYVRLAFAVAAHLEPEILVVDEVLAVGDAEFQKKCLGKMENIARGGERTVLFVSHNMGAITQLCTRALLLEGGRQSMIGEVEAVASAYLSSSNCAEARVDLRAIEPPRAGFQFLSVSVGNAGGGLTNTVDVRQPIAFQLEYEIGQSLPGLELTFRVVARMGLTVFSLNRSNCTPEGLKPGRYQAEIEAPAKFLAPGSYFVSLVAHIPNKEMIANLTEVLTFQVEELGSNMSLYPPGTYGAVMVDFPWREQPLAAEAI